MRNNLRTASIALAALFALAPLSAFAHAEPVGYAPQSSATVAEAPERVTIRFSERLDGASAMRVTGPSGEVASLGRAQVSSTDPYELSVPLRNDGDGTYFVSWSVVSADDGHFTKGAFAFAAGEGVVAAAVASSSVEIVQSSNAAEAVGMAAEFFGYGLACALLVLMAVAFKPLVSGSGDAQAERLIKKGFVAFMVAAALLAIGGQAAQVLVKSQSLATVQETSFAEALSAYLGTVAGTATAYRAAIIAVFLGAFLAWRKRVVAGGRFGWREGALVLALVAFAVVRARVSHATASQFAPELSVAVNALHVIAKDLWAGIAGVLAALALSERLGAALARATRNSFAALSVVAGGTSITACYIVWLHLKEPGNLFSTQWGSAFLALSIVAALLVVARIYHVAARLYRPALFSRLFPFTIAVELGLSLVMLYASSLSATTSPPLSTPHMRAVSVSDQGMSIRLEESRYEDGVMLLSASGGSKPGEPVVTALDASTGETVSVGVSPRFAGGWAFSRSLLAGEGPFTVTANVPQEGGYDARASFKVSREDLDAASNGVGRSFDGFAIAVTAVALSSAAFCAILYVLSRREALDEPSSQKSLREISVGAGLIASVALGASLMSSVSAAAWTNPYKALCEDDGNMWHLMLPTKAGKAVSSEAREGCMWGMGDYVYMFPDAREYAYYASLGEAEATLSVVPERPIAGAPSTMTISVRGEDGSPARLFVDMEKLVHVVVVSEDQTVFAHLHPDDDRPLTQAEIDSSTFSLEYAFPKAGRYLISVDYAHGVSLQSRRFAVEVAGGSPQADKVATYASPGRFDGFDVSLDYGLIVAGEPALLRYKVSKDGKPVDYLEPYLSAAMHVAVVKNDLSAFVHTHGEVHPPGAPYAPIRVKDGKIVHSMESMQTPPRFGPDVEAHVLFPEPGLYTIWGQFKAGGEVVPTSFTVRVE